jgi:hypothetical protein
LTNADVLSSWRIDGGTNGHTVAPTIGFVGALMDVAAEPSQQLPAGFVPADCEPR